MKSPPSSIPHRQPNIRTRVYCVCGWAARTPRRRSKGWMSYPARATTSSATSLSTALVYSTYLGGSSREEGNGLAVDPAGNAYVVGTTLSTDFPTANPLQATHKGPKYNSADGGNSRTVY